jgi:hypothetical protein
VRYQSASDLLRLIWGRVCGNRVMLSIRVAIDSSKDHERGLTVVAGHMADTDTWSSIDEPWANWLFLNGLDRLHLRELRRFGERWLEVVSPFATLVSKSGLRGISASLKDKEWAEYTSGLPDSQEYAQREHACLGMIWNVLHHERKYTYHDAPVTIAFDTDWGNRAAIVGSHEAWSESTGHPRFDVLLKGDASWDCVPLQAADMFAGLLRQDPFHVAMLDRQSLAGHIDELTRVAHRASGRHSHGTMWSKAVAETAKRVQARDAQPPSAPDSSDL